MTINITALTFDERDEFNRKVTAEKAITLLSSEIDVSPMVIDGSWGTGKTEFCHKLMNSMKQAESHHLIYVDAFQADHADEPLLTVLAEVLKILPEGEARSSFTQKVLPALRYGIKALAKAGVGHILRQDAADVVDDFDKEIQKAADNAIDSSVESMLKDHVKASESLKSLQEALQEIAAQKPIVLFIDELDRCRPNFAVNMLEIIKHTFDVEGVQFVLITNTQQLKASINHCYGHTVDAQRYLDKFIKFRFELSHLSDRNAHRSPDASFTHFLNLVTASSCLPADLLKNRPFLDFVRDIIREHSLSLREIETLARHIFIIQTLSSDTFVEHQYLGYTLLRFLSVFLFCFKPDVLRAVELDSLDSKLIGSCLGVAQIPSLEDDTRRPSIRQILMVMIARDGAFNAELYTPRDDDKNKWNEYIIKGFMGGYELDDNECSNIMKEASQILALAK